MLACSYSSLCSGCDWLLKPAERQRELKIENLKSVWERATRQRLPDVQYIPTAESGLRDRVDLVFDARSGLPRLGLFDRSHREIVDLQGCPMMSPDLESWFREFRKIRFPIQRGSVRLRVSPNGLRGAWLDFANIDIKNLLDERKTLDRLRSLAIVEIGQRRKRLVERDGLLKLSDPVLEPWFETWIDNNGSERAIPLYCAIGTFTQPGFKANRILVREVRRLVAQSGARAAFEFGSGIGNFTLPLASVCDHVEVFEIDALALEGLQRSLAEADLRAKVEIHRGDFQNSKNKTPGFEKADLVLVDPPRSGLKSFLDSLETLGSARKPKNFIYVSCFAESFAEDSRRLIDWNYTLQSITIVDQFPQSRHYELVAHFSVKKV